MLAKDRVKSVWSGVDVGGFGPYHESLAAALAEKVWADPAFKAELLRDAEGVLARETGLKPPAGRRFELIDKSPAEFYFVLPEVPPKAELWYRYEQLSGWWMLAHATWWWMHRQYGAKMSPFLKSLNVQIIGRSWNDPAWRQAVIDRPRETLEAELGAMFPPDLHVKSLTDTVDVVHLVLPTTPADEDVAAAAEYLAGTFAIAHTWWQWLVYPKLLRPANPKAVTAMVD